MAEKRRRRRRVKRSKLVILESVYDKNDDVYNLNVILFRNKRWNKFVTLGGRVDKCDNDFESALIREVREESLNMFDISNVIHSNRLKYIDFDDLYNNEIVRVYFLLINDGLFDIDIYNINRCILNSSAFCVPRCWTELDDCDRFPIDVILQLDYFKDVECVQCANINGKIQCLYSPIIKYIKEANRQNIINELLNGSLIIKDCVIDKDTSNTFLNGTSTIKVK